MESIKSLIKLAEEQDFEELQLPPSAFEDLKNSPGWQALSRFLASWISFRRDELETASVASEEDRTEFIKLQGALEALRNVLELPDVLETDARMDAEQPKEKEKKDG